MPLVMMKHPAPPAERRERSDSVITKGRTPIIFHCESNATDTGGFCNNADSQITSSRRNPFRRPPPYRNVPCSSSSSVTINPSVEVKSSLRAKSVPPSSKPPPVPINGGKSNGKPIRPKSIHQEFPATQSSPGSGVNPKRTPSVHFPHSVSLQFDSKLTATEWSDVNGQRELIPVPSPAPAERRKPVLRPSRVDNIQSSDTIRSCSVPRSLAPGRQPRPLSHPAAPQQQSQENLFYPQNPPSSSRLLQPSRSHGHLNHHQHPPPPAPPPRWPPSCLSLSPHSIALRGVVDPTPAPAPSPSSTPSPSGRFLIPGGVGHHISGLAHLPHDALSLRSNPSIRMLEKKLDLYVDIMQSQERFVQVP